MVVVVVVVVMMKMMMKEADERMTYQRDFWNTQ